VRRAFGRFRFDARVTGDAQLARRHGFAESAVERFVQRFVACLIAVLLLDDTGRHLARTEARHLDVLAHALQALVDVLVEIGNRHGEIQATLERVDGLFVGVCGVRFH